MKVAPLFFFGISAKGVAFLQIPFRRSPKKDTNVVIIFDVYRVKQDVISGLMANNVNS